MSHYRKIDTRVWNDSRFSSMTDDGKLAFLFILTHPALTPFGAMRATMDGLGMELGWKPERFAEGLREGLRDGYVEANQKACYIGAKNFIKYNGPDNVNMLKGMEKFIDLLPECPERTAMFKRTIDFVVSEKQSFNGKAEPFLEQLRKAIGKGFPEGYANGYANSQSTEHRAQSTDIPPLTHKGGDGEKPAKERKPRFRKSYDVEFEQFWKETRFPKKEQDTKGEMFKRYSAAIKAGCTVEEISKAADAFADANVGVQYPIGMRKFLEPMTIKEWSLKQETPKDTGPTQEELRAMRDRFIAAEAAQ